MLQCIDQLEGDYCVISMTWSVFCGAVQCSAVQYSPLLGEVDILFSSAV